jgi:hypothetical protein
MHRVALDYDAATAQQANSPRKANQIIMLQKLLIFSCNRKPTDPIDDRLSGLQTEMLLRLMMGAVFEVWLLIEKRFAGRPIGRDYQELLDPEGQKALAGLKKQFGSSNLLATIRNNFAFHFPNEKEVEDAFAIAFDDQNFDEEWNLYFARNKFNSSYMLCDVVFVHALFKSLGESDWSAGQLKIMKEVHAASDNIITFVHAYTAALWKKHIGAEMSAKVQTRIKNVPDLQAVLLPFFVTVQDDILSETTRKRAPQTG